MFRDLGSVVDRARDAECLEVPYSAGGGQVRRGAEEGRIEMAEAGLILRLVLDFRFVIWLKGVA